MAKEYHVSKSANVSAAANKSSDAVRIFSTSPLIISDSIAADFSAAARTSLSKSIRRAVVNRILPAIVWRWINPDSGAISASARVDGTSIKYPRILLYFIFKLCTPVCVAYSDCNAAIVSRAPCANDRILSRLISNPARITLPSRKNVGNSSASADRNSSASSVCGFIPANCSAKFASNRVANIWAFGSSIIKSAICRISRGVPRPDNNRDRHRPTSGTPSNAAATAPITSGFKIKCPMCSWRRRISSASPDSVRIYDRNLRAPAAVFVLSRTSTRHTPPSFIGASISKLFHVAESINNWRPDLYTYGARNVIAASRWVLNKYPASNATALSQFVVVAWVSIAPPNTRDTIWSISPR